MTRGIDHVVLCVRDLEAARRVYAALGFTLTPSARHPFGTANSLVQLEGNFLELLSVAEPAAITPARPGVFSFGAYNEQFLARREGMSMLVLQSTHARLDHEAFVRAGLDTYAPFDFERRAQLPDGTEVTVAFSLAFVTHRQMPQAVFFVCQQHAPEHFWRPVYQRHDNTAVAIASVTMVARRPAAFAEFLTALFGEGAVRAEGDALIVATDAGVLEVLSPGDFSERHGAPEPERTPTSPYFAAVRLAVANIDAAAGRLRRAALPCIEAAGVLRTEAADTFGVIVEFEQR